MPPKPWATKGIPPVQNISEIIQSNPTIKEEVPIVGANSTDPATNTTSINNSASNSLYGNSYGGGGLGMGSMYGGGLGSYGMGGLGGMGGMYGGMGGMGGMYGMGMGMGMGMEQSGALFNSMIALQSFGFLINSLSDIARSLDQNYEGLQLFKTSFKSLSSKVQNGVKGGVVGAGKKTKNAAFSLLNFVKTYVLCMGNRDQKSKLRSVKIIMALAAFFLIVSCYPLLKHMSKLR